MPSAALQQHLAAPHNYSFNSTSSFPPNYCPAVGARRFESSRDFCFACTDDMQTPRFPALLTTRPGRRVAVGGHEDGCEPFQLSDAVCGAQPPLGTS